MSLPAPPAAADEPPVHQLGTVTLGRPVPPSGCQAGFTCRNVTVTCPGVQQADAATVAVATPTGPATAVALFFSVSGGITWYTDPSTRGGVNAANMIAELVDGGFVAVQVRWKAGWHMSARGEDAGADVMACRPATIIQWVHDTYWAPLGLDPPPGQCGFCVTGNSASANAVVYALTHYGLDGVIDAAIPTGGPSVTDLVRGCLNDGDFTFPVGNRRNIDAARGFRGFAGPCAQSNPDYTSRWRAESAATGGSDFTYPTTRVSLILGEHEDLAVVTQGRAYEDQIVAAGSPMVTEDIAPGIGHDVCANAQGIALLKAAFLATP